MNSRLFEQSKTEPQKKAKTGAFRGGLTQCRKIPQPYLEQGTGNVRKGRVHAAQKLRGPDPAGALLRGLSSRPGPGSAGAGPSREHEQPPSLRVGSLSPKVTGPGLGFPGTHRLRASGRPGPAGGAEDGGGARSGARRLGNELPLRVLQHARTLGSARNPWNEAQPACAWSPPGRQSHAQGTPRTRPSSRAGGAAPR